MPECDGWKDLMVVIITDNELMGLITPYSTSIINR